MIRLHTWIEISASAIQHNTKIFGQMAGPRILAPVLKSNAYGHGFDQVFEILRCNPPDWICTNFIAEGRRLRELGFCGRVLNVGPISPDELESAAAERIDILLAKQDTFDSWVKLSKPPLAHIKLDSGLSRQGFYLDRFPKLLSQIPTSIQQNIVGLCTHFANVEDVTKHDYAHSQISQFTAASEIMSDHGYTPICHAASSASSLILPESQFDLLRVGVSIYGHWPSASTRLSYLQEFGSLVELRPALSWKANLMDVKAVKVGDFVGYGCSFRINRPMKLGLTPVGYYEGYPRLSGNSNAYALVRGQRCPIVGRISMNMMMIDLSGVPSPSTGDEVVLIGQQGQETLGADEVASWGQSINYEILTRLNATIPRHITK
jgi:alanine racemase